MNMYTILKYRRWHTKKHLLNYYKTFLILKCWSNKFDFG